MTKTIDQILAPKPEVRPRIYAYSIADEAHQGWLKIGQTTRDVKQRVAEQLRTAAIKNYTIELDESAEGADGRVFTDHDVRAALLAKKFANPELEWMCCTVADVKTVLAELRAGRRFTGTHHETFSLRREQAEAQIDSDRTPEEIANVMNPLWACWLLEHVPVPREWRAMLLARAATDAGCAADLLRNAGPAAPWSPDELETLLASAGGVQDKPDKCPRCVSRLDELPTGRAVCDACGWYEHPPYSSNRVTPVYGVSGGPMGANIK